MHALVPPSVTLVETECDVPTMLYPAEQSYIAAAVEKRRAEFTTVRYCAGRAEAGAGGSRGGRTAARTPLRGLAPE